jgi:phospholipid/cholesterol/gamma-HCH transport system substrate-binding protein
MMIRKEVQQFIKQDCEAAIGSEGIIGDRLLVITQGSSDAPMVKDGQKLVSTEPVETDAIMANLNVSSWNAGVITEQLAEIMTKINSGNGTLGRLIQDSPLQKILTKRLRILKKSSKGLDENMEAAKHKFSSKGYFNKKEKAAAKLKEKEQKEAEEKKKKEEEQKLKDGKHN